MDNFPVPKFAERLCAKSAHGPLVYEINPRLRLTALKKRLRRQKVTLADIPNEDIERWAELGFHYLWMLGVWTIGAASRRRAWDVPLVRDQYRAILPDLTADDVCGSPFAVGAYETDPELGGNEALAAFREKLHRVGLGLILDFVPNHLAHDHRWTVERPELFIRGTEKDLELGRDMFFRAPNGFIFAHGRDPYFPGWTDTVQLDYGNAATHQSMSEEFLKVASRCDGLRCDMAMLLLPDVRKRVWREWAQTSAQNGCFWQALIPKLRAVRPEFLLMAEVYWGLEGEMLIRGFDYAYNKTLYDLLRAGNGAGVRGLLSNGEEFLSRCVQFVENHDEQRAFEAFGPQRLGAALAAACCAPGLKLIHDGQIEGRQKRLPVQLRRAPEEASQPGIIAYHEKLFSFLRHPLFFEGEWEQREIKPSGSLDFTYQFLVAQAWWGHATAGRRSNTGRLRHAVGLLIIANLSEHDAYARLPLPKALFGRRRWRFTDHADGADYIREGKELTGQGLFVSLKGGQTHLFEITPENV
jgi:hypothetical protein